MLYTDNIGLKKPAYSEPADIADINENMDTIDREFGNRYLKSETYSVEQANNAIAQAIEALPNGLVYRGAVNYYKDLPTANNELGDTYSVKYQGETGTTADGNEYAWGEYDGTLQWIKLGVNAYTKDEIDEQHEVIKSDILSVKNDVAINRVTLGTQKKNLLDFEKFLTEREATFTKEGDEYTVTTNSALNTQKYYFAEENTRVIISGILTNVTSSNARISLIDTNGNVVNGYAIDATHTSTVSVAAGLKFDWSSTGRFKINELMIRPADITDDAYEPYKPSLQEQINALVERIQVLETAQTTVSE